MKLIFKKYTPTPNDKYNMLGFAEVLIPLEGGSRIGLRFKHIMSKDGKSTFFCACTIGIEEGAEKKYYPDHFMDSRSDDDEMQAWIRQEVSTWKQKNSAPPQTPQWNPNIYSPTQVSISQTNDEVVPF